MFCPIAGSSDFFFFFPLISELIVSIYEKEGSEIDSSTVRQGERHRHDQNRGKAP